MLYGKIILQSIEGVENYTATDVRINDQSLIHFKCSPSPLSSFSVDSCTQ